MQIENYISYSRFCIVQKQVSFSNLKPLYYMNPHICKALCASCVNPQAHFNKTGRAVSSVAAPSYQQCCNAENIFASFSQSAMIRHD